MLVSTNIPRDIAVAASAKAALPREPGEVWPGRVRIGKAVDREEAEKFKEAFLRGEYGDQAMQHIHIDDTGAIESSLERLVGQYALKLHTEMTKQFGIFTVGVLHGFSRAYRERE